MPVVAVAVDGWVGWVLAWLGTWLIHSTPLLGAAWAVSRTARSPGVRDALWKAALVASFVSATAFVAVRRGAPPVLPPPPVVAEGAGGPSSQPFTLLSVGRETGSRVPPWTGAVVLAIWAAGAAAALAGLERGRRWYWRTAGERHAVADAEAADTLRRLRAVAGVRRTIYLTAAEGLQAPAAIGLAEICLPVRALEALTPAQRESVMAHELGHLARRDPVWKVAVELTAALFWFQPLLRVARRQLAECAELLCDGFAVRVTGRRRPLVESLGVLAAAFRPCGVAAAGFGDGGSALLRRARRVMDASRAPAAPLPAVAQAALLLLALAGTLGFSPGLAPPLPRQIAVFREVTMEGARLNPARTAVESVAPGGFLRLATAEQGVRRELTVRRGADGRPAYDYRENGVSRPYDARASRWLAETLRGR